jgi:hypothetical protein
MTGLTAGLLPASPSGVQAAASPAKPWELLNDREVLRGKYDSLAWPGAAADSTKVVVIRMIGHDFGSKVDEFH